ncbi:MAG: hypothetical protein IJJ40_07150 [Clostridia bacterium]|nr:hypothetical protein [Clostridia bacterium]
MKKLFSLLVCLILILGLSLNVAADSVKLDVTGNEKTVEKGDTVTLTLSVKESVKTASVALSIEHTSGLSVASCEITASDTKLKAFDKEKNNAVAAFEGEKDIKGELAVIKIKVDKSSSGKQSVDLLVKTNPKETGSAINVPIKIKGENSGNTDSQSSSSSSSKSEDTSSKSSNNTSSKDSSSKTEKNDEGINSDSNSDTTTVGTAKANHTKIQLMVAVCICIFVFLIIFMIILVSIKKKAKSENKEKTKDDKK